MRTCLLLIAVLCLPVVVRAQDPVKVDAKHYKVDFENDQVRVLKIHYAPHEKSVMHEHPDAVAIFITGGNARFNNPDGTTTPSDAKAGDVRFTPAGKHLPENVGTKPFDVVLVELKGKPGSAAAIAMDPVKVDPAHHAVLVENDRVRVLRIQLGPHEKTKQHDHPNGVSVPLIAGQTKITTADGKSRTVARKAGEAVWLSAERHVVENPDAKPVDIILVELK